MLPRRTRHWAVTLQWMTWVTMLALVILIPYSLFDPAALVAQAHDSISKAPGDWTTGSSAIALLIGASLLQLAVTLLILWHMSRLFGCYAKGEALSLPAARHIRGIGIWTLVRALMAVLHTPFVSLVLSIDAPEGQRSLSVAIDSHLVALSLVGGMMLMIGMVIAQAVAIARENESFV